ncbi:eukaryotic protein [Schizosaccharomyces japonicus yFS275]|uniref:Eukaryotic protein n=1 Tax=Schizosaccharomyces japonicus (strain yFS275 / FY16936) TaxID=402676 RepID=B6JV19_SCHJY|nr:eukaryotic protein [Schizosaccharomyces japonicus yFS275]EEB05220.1 eukaryotic protein [Schizosaccharomyces japonicus yFS275]
MFNITKSLSFGSITKSLSFSSPTEPYTQTPKQHVDTLRRLFKGFDMMMNDEFEAIRNMFHDDSPTSLLVEAGSQFFQAMLGMEPGLVNSAMESLSKADEACEHLCKQVSRHNQQIGSYPAGWDWQVCVCDIALMHAVLGFAAGSLVDSMKAAYRIRKTFLSFEKMMGVVRETQAKKRKSGKTQTEDEKFVDEFVESGVLSGYAILTFLVSLFPPTLARILSLLSFHGNRKESLEILWTASPYSNIQGAIAGLTLYAFYGMLQGFSSFAPLRFHKELKECTDLLSRIHQRYPQGTLWLAMDAKLQYMVGNIDRSLAMLESPLKAQLTQIVASRQFEGALIHLSLRNFPRATKEMLDLLNYSKWSNAFYYYAAGCATLQLAKDSASSKEPTTMAHVKDLMKKAEQYLLTSTQYISQKKFMGSNLPVEVYLSRKLRKWKARAVARNASSITEVMQSPPYVELLYIFSVNCFHHQVVSDSIRRDVLNAKCTDTDEIALRDFFLGVIARSKKDYAAAEKQYQKVVSLNKSQMQQEDRDFWVIPFAHYELAAMHWETKGLTAKHEIVSHLKKASDASGYDWQGRMSLMCQLADQTIKSEEST